MGSYNLDGWESAVARIREQAYEGALETARQVQSDAVHRAPVRKAFKGGKRAKTSDIRAFEMKVRGGGRLTGGEIKEAAALLGINVSDSQVAALGHGQLGHGGSAANRGSSSAGMAARQRLRVRRDRFGQRVLGSQVIRNLPSGKVRVEGNQRRRAFSVGKSVSGRLSGRAKYDIKRGRGVILLGGGQAQYGGYLRKHIHVVEDYENHRVSVRSEAPYSRYVEFPTSRTAAQPYLLPAFKAARGRLAGNIRRSKG
jgi:hypothetical protein